MPRLILPFALVLLVAAAWAETSVGAVFGEHLVLQRDQPVRIWGTDTAGQAVSVQLGDQAAVTATAGADGRWSVGLPAQQAGGPLALRIQGSTLVERSDVLIGEVWLCSGQSNMAFPLAWLKAEPTNPQTAEIPHLRLFKVENASRATPAADCKGTWATASGDISGWSATAFHFGKALQAHLGVPVGLIVSSVGGTPIESWVASEVLDSQKEISGHVGYLMGQIAKYPELKAAHDQKVAEWEAGGKQGDKPKANLYAPDSPWRPAGLYNGMIAPLVGYGIRGAVWYQGESNAGRANVYGTTLCNLISDWRKQWKTDFPFITVQLAAFKQDGPFNAASSWALLREAQNQSLTLPRTGVAVTIDVGDAKDIHPKRKKPVGERCALLARRLAYGETLVATGPVFAKAEVSGTEIRLTFTEAEGLAASAGDLTGFNLAGEDKAWVAAKARIDGTSVVVSAEGLSAPRFVRYAWADNPAGNLVNGAGLPASPFRTDTE